MGKNKWLSNITFTFLTAVLLMSCSRAEPEITFGFIKLVLYESETGYNEHFSFFVIPQDDDGMENLDKMYLYHDREQLRWRITSDEWLRSTHDGKDWIGTRSIAISEGSLPRGVFRAVLVNKGGESSQRTFTYDGSVRFPFPEIEITDGRYNVVSQWPENKLICYDSSGNYSATVTLSSLSGDVSQLKLPLSARTVALWAEDEANFCSAVTNVVPVN